MAPAFHSRKEIMSITDRAKLEIQVEKESMRVAEAKHWLKRIEALGKERNAALDRLVALDTGAEPSDYDPFTGDRIAQGRRDR
jgi:hypothetical protein